MNIIRCPNCGSIEIVSCPDGLKRCRYCETIVEQTDVESINPNPIVSHDEDEIEQPLVNEEKPQKSFGLLWLLLLLFLVGICIGGYFFLKSSDEGANQLVIDNDSIPEITDPALIATKERLTEILSKGMLISDHEAVKRFFSEEFKEVYEKVDEYDKIISEENNEPGFENFPLWGNGRGDYGNLQHYDIKNIQFLTELTALVDMEYVFENGTVFAKFQLVFENANWVIDEIIDGEGRNYKKDMKSYIERLSSNNTTEIEEEDSNEEDNMIINNTSQKEDDNSKDLGNSNSKNNVPQNSEYSSSSATNRHSTSTTGLDTRIYDVVDRMPSFQGGQAALMSWLKGNIKYPVVAEENGIQGRVVCTFVIECDGSITNVQVVNGVDPSLDKEAVRVLKQMPKWIPGYNKDGQPVRVKYTTPVTFRLQ